jgi:class 3 adenylate cyclase
MSDIEQRVLDRFREFLEIWVTRRPTTRDDAIRCMSESFRGFGTARHEIFEEKQSMIAQLEREISQMPDGMELKLAWAQATALSDDICGVTGEIAIRTRYGDRVVTVDPIRITCTFRLEGEEFRIVQWHTSCPDASLEEEVFPGSTQPKRYEEITVALTDFAGFSGLVFSVPPKRLVMELNEIFSAFDEITKNHGVAKIKTIGDAYMCACGLKNGADDHAIRMIEALRAMFAFLEQRNVDSALKWAMRAGVHSGPAVGGIIGAENLTFDLWGDTVNLASRMEDAGEAGKINVSAYTYDLIQDRYPCTYRGKIGTKDRGKMDMYFVD